MEKRTHKIHPDKFCYICAEFIHGSKKPFNATMREAYWNYFKSSFNDVDMNFTPSFICSTCQRNLYRFKNSEIVTFPFNIPAIWTNISSHNFGICYFCSIEKRYFKSKANYFDCDSCKIPKLCLQYETRESSNTDSQSVIEIDVTDVDYEEDNIENFEWSVETFNDFCRELNLSKFMSKKCLRMLKKDSDLKTKLMSIKNRHVNDRSKYAIGFFSNSDDITFCHDINGLMEYIGVNYSSDDWCLFIDASNYSLKAALMYRSHHIPTIPIAYTYSKEDRSSIEKILKCVNYNTHCWLIMCDLKVLKLIMGLKAGYAKYPCFYCFFDSRNSQQDFDINHTWPARDSFDNVPLVDTKRIAIPFLHIKLGLFQKFVKTLNKDSECFKFISRTVRKSEAKLLNGVFTGPEIRLLMRNKAFPGTMLHAEHVAWINFCSVSRHVLGKDVSEDWKQKVDSLMSSFQNLGCLNVTSKMHLLSKHKDKYEKYLGIYSDEHGERLHKDMQSIEKRYGKSLNKEMLAEYIWSLKRDTHAFKRKETTF